MRIKNFFLILALVFCAGIAYAKGGGKLYIQVNSNDWFPIEGCVFSVYAMGGDKPVCWMRTDGNGKAKSKKLKNGSYVVYNELMTMGYNNLGYSSFTIDDDDVHYTLWAEEGMNAIWADKPDPGVVKVTISGTLSKDVLAYVEAFPHIAIVDHLVQGSFFTYAYPLVCAKNGKSANASKAYKKDSGLKAKLATSGHFSFSFSGYDCQDMFAFGFYVNNELYSYWPEDFKASCSGKVTIKDWDTNYKLGTNGQFWLETFWQSQNFLFGGQSIELNDKWRGTGSGTWDGIESKVSVHINKKNGKFKVAITSWDAVGVNVRYGTIPE
jgi:hypothetical protein